MKTYALIFRMDITTESAQPSAKQMETYMNDWMKWVNLMSENGQLAEGGNHFSKAGKLLRPGEKTQDGPYTENSESVAGYLLVHAKDMDGAVTLAEKCPILNGEGTSVEIRELATPGEMQDMERS
jgi:hypothetical protein